ncbi:hypothetical protein PHMEG_00011675 [Phytophthora megakarya]|uniref:Uncharacterized protein n=1 Tax=Phytophthora megakarya TaxID=4795 RepID=A0A225WAP2_9STRA|nr:hypothetical protein PHMEG_00011675 [Phytophthora megakarya]
MDEDTKEYLREFAAILPRSSGKWIKVLEEYKTRNPKTRLTPENLRGRLKLRSKDVRAARPERSATESLTSKPMEDDSGVEPMDDETREYLREIAAALPRTSGKWTKVLQEYKKRNPKTKLTPENLRGRLKWKKPRVRRDVPNQPVVTKEGRKRQRLIAACSSCQKAKVKCGADSKNRDCEYRDIAHNQSKET